MPGQFKSWLAFMGTGVTLSCVRKYQKDIFLIPKRWKFKHYMGFAEMCPSYSTKEILIMLLTLCFVTHDVQNDKTFSILMLMLFDVHWKLFSIFRFLLNAPKTLVNSTYIILIISIINHKLTFFFWTESHMWVEWSKFLSGPATFGPTKKKCDHSYKHFPSSYPWNEFTLLPGTFC